MAIQQLFTGRTWLNGKECNEAITVTIHQEQDLKRHPITGELIPDKLWTSARMRIAVDAIGQDEDNTILNAQKSRKRVTIAHALGNSVLVARDLRPLEYDYDSNPNDVYVEINFNYGAPLERMPLDEWLASLETESAA